MRTPYTSGLVPGARGALEAARNAATGSAQGPNAGLPRPGLRGRAGVAHEARPVGAAVLANNLLRIATLLSQQVVGRRRAA